MIPRTTWAGKDSPYTGKVPITPVPIPDKPKQRKGATKYDREFETMLANNTAIELHEDNFQTIRRAMQRFMDYREIRGKVSVRQQLNPQTRMMTLWFEKKEQK